jgi:hypothetical protein
MRGAPLTQLPPDGHPLHPAPRFRQLLQCGLAVCLYESLERLWIGNLLRVAPLVAHARLDIARGLFARQPCRDGIAVQPKYPARFFHLHSFLYCGTHPNTQIITVRTRHPVPPPERFLS